LTEKEKGSVTLNSKAIALMASMGALGNVLAAITIVPTIVQQVALDFSALPVLIMGVFGGPIFGGLTGVIAGVLPSIFFGFIGGGLGFLGFSNCVGKAIHGVVVGLLARTLRPVERRKTLLLIPIVLLGFVPEAIWIALVFKVFVPLFIPSQAFLSVILPTILAKATFEVCIMGFFTSALAGHEGFKSFVYTYLKP
jgi:LytS/YehU family sensor histidine kinase